MLQQNQFSQSVRECSAQLAEVGIGALGALFDLTSQRLVRFAVAITRHQQDAEDAVQTCLVRVAGQPTVLARADCPWAYLLRMVRNDALLIARKKKRWSTTGSLADLVTRCRVDELEREETFRAVWRAIRMLPAEQAEVVVLKIWEGMTFAQIGAILDSSPNTVASRYQYAMTKLTQSLQKQREVFHG